MRLASSLAVLAVLTASLSAGEPKRVRCEEIDYGGALGGSYVLHPDAVYKKETGDYTRDSCAKAIAVDLGEKPGFVDGVIFDIDSLRIAAAWTGGFPRLIGWWLNGTHGPTSRLGVPPLFATRGPGWASPAGSFADPRPDLVAPLPRPGPLPKAWAHYHGRYRHGRQSVFSYRVGDAEVLELLTIERGADGAVAVARTFAIAAHAKPLAVVLADAASAAAKAPAGLTAIASTAHAAIAAAPEGAAIAEAEDNLVLRLPPAAAPTLVKVLVAGGGTAPAALAALAKASPKPTDLAALTKGGPGLWGKPIAVASKRGADDGPWAVDAIGLPSDNPHKAWLRPSALDFFADGGTAAVATLNGDVWLVRGIDDKLDQVTWQRFASGLHAPLGLKIVDGVIHVGCRDGILRLHDRDQDGEADFYESFNHDLLQTPSFHSFVCDLNTDPEGRFYFGVGGAIINGGYAFQRLTPHLGTIMRLAKDGSVLETFATGCRMPNGGSVGPKGEVTTSDNQGVWVPATPIHWVSKGDFLGVCNTAHGATTHPPKPLCFLPQAVDSSACSQVWVTSDKWGPHYRGGLLHMSYGKAGLFAVMRDQFDGAVQGGAVRLPVTLTSSGLRGRFNPRDGQLYVVGLKMGQTTALTEGGFDRIRFTGKPACLPTGLRTLADGVAITFSQPLDKAKAEDPGNWAVEAWNYNWTQAYGSPEVPFLGGGTPAAGNRKGSRSILAVKAARLSADGLTASLTLPDLKPVWNLGVTCKAATADGAAVNQSVVMTIHAMPK